MGGAASLAPRLPALLSLFFTLVAVQKRGGDWVVENTNLDMTCLFLSAGASALLINGPYLAPRSQGWWED